MSLLLTSLFLPRPLPEVFQFFADAGNLQRITPPWVDFRIATPLPIAMHVGALIDYRLKVHGVPIRWRTEITAWQPPHHFVDTQLSGPYWRWVHSHRFREAPGGTVAEDDVDFAVPGAGQSSACSCAATSPASSCTVSTPPSPPSASRPTCPPPCSSADL